MRALSRKLRPVKLRLSFFYWMVGGVLFVALSLWVASWSFRVSQDWQALQKQPTDATKKQFDASLDVVKAIVGGISTIATMAGGVVLYLNFKVVKQKLEQETGKAKADAKLADARLTMERFSKAVDMMGSDKSIHLRLGGIYALESIALDSSDDKIDENYRQVLEVLSAFVRENSPYPPPKQTEKEAAIPSPPIEQLTAEAGEQHEEISSLPIDIQAALTVLNRRKHKDTDWKQYPIDLSRTDLRRADLSKADLQKARLVRANLQYADLGAANLQGADLQEANLQEANLAGAKLEKAQLLGANLQEARLGQTDLRRSYLSKADLQRANLVAANLQGANLGAANFQGANLARTRLQSTNLDAANLKGADLQEANLAGAFLKEANLTEALLDWASLQCADLSGANLRSVNLHRADLSGASLEWAYLGSANLQRADLNGVLLQDAILLATDLRNAKNLDQIMQLGGKKPPLLCNVALPESCPDKDTLKDRDCADMPQVLLQRYPQQFKIEAAKKYVDEARQKKWE